MRHTVFLAALLTLCSLVAFSQTTSTTILGTVTDSTGAVISGAKVTAANVNTGISRVDTTTASGDFSFPLLDVGIYSVTVEMQGFKTETRKGIELQINQKARVDFTGLQVGSQAETVTITGEVAQLKTDEASLGSVVEGERVHLIAQDRLRVAGGGGYEQGA